MNTLHSFLGNVTRIVLSPTAGWSPLVGLVLLSALFGIVVAIIFRWTSNQERLRRVADLCRAQVLAIKLFKDEPKTIFKAFRQLLHYSLVRIWCLVPSMIVLLIPSILLLVHLAVWYEHKPLTMGEAAVLELQFAENAWAANQDVLPDLPAQFAIETPPLRDLEEKSILWRVRVKEPVPATIRWQVGSEVFEKKVAVSGEQDTLVPVSVRRPGSGWWDRLIHPAEEALKESSPLRGITIHHQQRSTPVFGWDVPWWVTVLFVSILAALLVRPLVKVQF
ncbi:MAG: hypothetical protein MI725_00710 [Pirellulales bacterium]|nr:hypothetical protein [Pirellulales bacterium]